MAISTIQTLKKYKAINLASWYHSHAALINDKGKIKPLTLKASMRHFELIETSCFLQRQRLNSLRRRFKAKRIEPVESVDRCSFILRRTPIDIDLTDSGSFLFPKKADRTKAVAGKSLITMFSRYLYKAVFRVSFSRTTREAERAASDRQVVFNGRGINVSSHRIKAGDVGFPSGAM